MKVRVVFLLSVPRRDASVVGLEPTVIVLETMGLTN